MEFRYFTSEMIDAAKQMVAELNALAGCEGCQSFEGYDLNYFQNDGDYPNFDELLVHYAAVDGDSSIEIVQGVESILERCNNCRAGTIWYCQGSLGDREWEYAPTLGTLWFVTGTEEEALSKIRGTAEYARQMENT